MAFRWVDIRSGVLAGIFASGLAVYLIYGRSTDASTIGFSLTMAGKHNYSLYHRFSEPYHFHSRLQCRDPVGRPYVQYG